MSPVVGSVVIPAHQEEAVVARCLRAVLDGPHDLEVVVVVNGSTDGTARRARDVPVRDGHRVTVVDLPAGGKAGALNAGDDVATAFPRLYVDADVVCSNEAVAATCRLLADGTLDAAAPTLTYDLAAVPWPVAAYTRVWLRLHRTPELIGSGVYGVSRTGRGRFEQFPTVIADDAFVRSRFAPDERRAVGASFTAYPPRRTWSLVKRKSRVFLGHLELEREGLALDLEHNLTPRELVRAADRPPLADLAAYGAITLAAKGRATWQLRRGRTDVWERDESTR